MSLIRITNSNRAEYLQQIQNLEQQSEYPLGDDSFKVNHGPDYFRFFERLGRLHYYVWVEDGVVAAVAAAVLRTVPLGKAWQRAWYLSDLKVRGDFRNRQIPLKMMSRAFLPNYFRCRRGYAISMNAEGRQDNKMARLLQRFKWTDFKEAATLHLWSLNEHEMQCLKPVIYKHRGPMHALSLRGIKDIVLNSTGAAMPLNHVQFGPLADITVQADASQRAMCMFCSPKSDPMSEEIAAMGFMPTATATVIAHRMDASDWTWVLTSEI